MSFVKGFEKLKKKHENSKIPQKILKNIVKKMEKKEPKVEKKEEEIVEKLCKCNKTAVERIVKKEGINKGKSFYTCADGGCKYFEWKVFVPVGNPYGVCCNCPGVEAVIKNVQKEGENKGKRFYTCEKKNCTFFKWVDD
jgi:hypothetical protein